MGSVALLALTILGAAYAVYRYSFKNETSEYTELSLKEFNMNKKTVKNKPLDENVSAKKKEKEALSPLLSTRVVSVPMWEIPSDTTINEQRQAYINSVIQTQKKYAEERRSQLMQGLVDRLIGTGCYRKQALTCLTQEQKQWDPFPIDASKSEFQDSSRANVNDDDNLSHHLLDNGEKFHVPVITMEKILSECSINYENIIDLDNPYDLQELKKLVEAIQDKRIDLNKLLSTIMEKSEELDFSSLDSDSYGSDYSDLKPIEDFLVFMGFLNIDTYRKELVKKSSETFSKNVILNFRALSCDFSGRFEGNGNVLEKTQFLENLKFILTADPNKHISYSLCDQILNHGTEFYETLAIAELRKFLLINDLWSPTLSERSLDDIDKNLHILMPNGVFLEKEAFSS